LVKELEQSFAARTAAEWVDELLAKGIPAGPIYNYEQALSSEHALHRETVMEIDHPVEGRVRSIGFPIKLSWTKQRVSRHPPLLGEHTDEILSELGFGVEEVARMRTAGDVA
jgi:crotonobetainyl-CoA:carnitine CoA-transferase CaiB-like acyl-CoA transferase